jgi:hypothetical protein
MSYAVDGKEVDSKWTETVRDNVRQFISTNHFTTITATCRDDRKMYGLSIRYVVGNETKEQAIECPIEQLSEVVGEWMGHTEMQRVIVNAGANAVPAAAAAAANAAPKG